MKKILISGLKTNSTNYVNAVMGVWEIGRAHV